MKFTAIPTPIIKENEDLLEIIQQNVAEIPEESILVVTSKIISYAQGRLVEQETGTREEHHELVKQEADSYLPSSYSKYDTMLAIKNHTLTVNAGVDQSNSSGKYVLWPENMQEEANKIWQFVRDHYGVKKVGVVVTDSRTWPLRWGVIGTALVHSGFKQLTSYIGKKDLFGREIEMVQVNIAEAVAAGAALEMGEVAEQTPMCLVENIKQIQFQDRVPTEKELTDLQIEVENDVYGPFLTSVEWVKRK